MLPAVTCELNYLILKFLACKTGSNFFFCLIALENSVNLTLKDIFANTETLDAKLIKEPAHRRQSSKL